jgi:hypothetical protein
MTGKESLATYYTAVIQCCQNPNQISTFGISTNPKDIGTAEVGQIRTVLDACHPHNQKHPSRSTVVDVPGPHNLLDPTNRNFVPEYEKLRQEAIVAGKAIFETADATETEKAKRGLRTIAIAGFLPSQGNFVTSLCAVIKAYDYSPTILDQTTLDSLGLENLPKAILVPTHKEKLIKLLEEKGTKVFTIGKGGNVDYQRDGGNTVDIFFEEVKSVFEE